MTSAQWMEKGTNYLYVYISMITNLNEQMNIY